jgi:hypothetical protein
VVARPSDNDASNWIHLNSKDNSSFNRRRKSIVLLRYRVKLMGYIVPGKSGRAAYEACY